MRAARSTRLNARLAEWEWRAFWLSADTAPLIYEVFVNPARCAHDQLADRYLVIDTRQDNIKIRNDSLLVKQLIEQYDGSAPRSSRRWSAPRSCSRASRSRAYTASSSPSPRSIYRD